MLANRMKNLCPYVPGEQPSDREYIKLNANENPFPPSPKVKDALLKAVQEEFPRLSRYTDPDSSELRNAIASLLNATGGVLCRATVNGTLVFPEKKDALPFEITPDMIHVGNGSDEVLSHVFYAFFDDDRPLISPEYSYSFYPVYSGYYGIPLKKIPLKNDWSLDVESMIFEANKNHSATIIANPNAPTALTVSRQTLREWISRVPGDKPFVVDEAYCDFGGESALSLLSEFPNLAVVRTFSKSLCGAGIRLGFVVASKELIEAVKTAKNSFNHFPVDFLASVSGIAACSDCAYYVGIAKEICRVRDDFSDFLKSKGWSVLDSRTNFIFAKKEHLSGLEAYKKIKADGILVRHFDSAGIEDFIRISVGTKEQMEILKKTMAEM